MTTNYSDKNITEDLIKQPVTLNDTYQDFGNKICTKGLNNVGLWLKGLRNDSDLINIRIKCFKSEDSTDPFYPQIQLIGKDVIVLDEELYEIGAANINLVLPLGISTLVPYIQIEAKVATAGTTPAIISEARVSYDRR